MLFGLKPEAGQTGVTGVSVHVRTGRGGIRAGGCRHRRRIEGGAVQVVQVSQVIKA